jgi:hypothetical protein
MKFKLYHRTFLAPIKGKRISFMSLLLCASFTESLLAMEREGYGGYGNSHYGQGSYGYGQTPSYNYSSYGYYGVNTSQTISHYLNDLSECESIDLERAKLLVQLKSFRNYRENSGAVYSLYPSSNFRSEQAITNMNMSQIQSRIKELGVQRETYYNHIPLCPEHEFRMHLDRDSSGNALMNYITSYHAQLRIQAQPKTSTVTIPSNNYSVSVPKNTNTYSSQTQPSVEELTEALRSITSYLSTEKSKQKTSQTTSPVSTAKKLDEKTAEAQKEAHQQYLKSKGLM